jgi:uncharacterized membrane protein
VSNSRDPDRLVLFTDAVVAIAITLLVLPLVDLVSQAVANHTPSTHVISDNLSQLLTFLLSFVVIARFWLMHHRIFEHVRTYNQPLIELNLVWVLTIVVLPFPTEMASAYSDQFTAGLYVGTILASSACQTAMIVLIHRRPELETTDNRLSRRNRISAISGTALLAVAFLLAALVPHVNYFALLLLLLTRPVVWLWFRIHSTSDPVEADQAEVDRVKAV